MEDYNDDLSPAGGNESGREKLLLGCITGGAAATGRGKWWCTGGKYWEGGRGLLGCHGGYRNVAQAGRMVTV